MHCGDLNGKEVQKGDDTCVHGDFPGGSDGKENACNAGDLGSIPGLGRSPRGGDGNPLVFLPGECPWREELGRLQSMGSPRVVHD